MMRITKRRKRELQPTRLNQEPVVESIIFKYLIKHPWSCDIRPGKRWNFPKTKSKRKYTKQVKNAGTLYLFAEPWRCAATVEWGAGTAKCSTASMAAKTEPQKILNLSIRGLGFVAMADTGMEWEAIRQCKADRLQDRAPAMWMKTTTSWMNVDGCGCCARLDGWIG